MNDTRTPGSWSDRSAGALVGVGWSALLVGVVWWTTIFVPSMNEDFTVAPIGITDAVVLTAASVGLLLRHRHPLVMLVLTVGADFCSVVFDLGGSGYHYAGLFGVFFVALRYPLDRAVALIAVPMGAVYVAEVWNAGWRWLAFAPVWVIVSTALAAAFGQVRYLREHLYASLQEQVASAEATQEALARTRVAEDRLRTARELHDVIGHRIAVVHLRAAAAARSLAEDPENARRALTDIDEASRAVLRDIDHLLADLRASDTPPAESDLMQLDELIAEFRRYGVQVRAEVTGDLARVPDVVSRVGYQSVLETLTNALKHGRADRAVDLVVHERAGTVDLRVVNEVSNRPVGPLREGWGLDGLRERVAAVAGDVRVSAGDRFIVEISLPAEVTP